MSFELRFLESSISGEVDDEVHYIFKCDAIYTLKGGINGMSKRSCLNLKLNDQLRSFNCISIMRFYYLNCYLVIEVSEFNLFVLIKI